MTNGEKFTSPDERYVEFKKFCHKYACGNCPVNEDGIMEAKCGFKWLDLEYKEELKNCPFCGDESVNIFKSDNMNIWYVSCSKCGVRTEGDTSKEMAIDAWNMRV